MARGADYERTKYAKKFADGGMVPSKRELPLTPLRDLESSDIDFQQAKLLKKALKDQRKK